MVLIEDATMKVATLNQMLKNKEPNVTVEDVRAAEEVVKLRISRMNRARHQIGPRPRGFQISGVH